MRFVDHKAKARIEFNYDPSATKVNQENRIKLMLAVAKERLTTKADPAPVTAEELAGGAPQVETQVPAML